MAPPFLRSRFVSVFLGGALGDALGAPLESSSAPDVKKRLEGEQGDALHLLAASSFTDDTQLTLWVAEGLIRAHQRKLAQGVPSVEEAVRDSLLRWYVTQEPSERSKLLHADSGRLLSEGKLAGKHAPENTNLLTLGELLSTRGWKPAGDPSSDSPGALMRSAPYAVFGDVEECYEYARLGASVTHAHPSATLPAAFFAALIHGLLRERPFKEAFHRSLRLMEASPEHEPIAKLLGHAIDKPSLTLDLDELGGGWRAESTLAIALNVFLSAGEADEPTDATLKRAVSHGGKSETTGALVGQLLAATHGPEALPQEWLALVKGRGVVEGVATDLYDAWVVGTQLELEPYPAG